MPSAREDVGPGKNAERRINSVSLAHSGSREPECLAALARPRGSNENLPRGYGFTIAIDVVVCGMRMAYGDRGTSFPFSTRCNTSSERSVSATNMKRPVLSKTANSGPVLADIDGSPALVGAPAESVWSSEPVSFSTLNAVIPVSAATNKVSWTADSDRAGALIVNGDPGTRAREPSLLILNAVIRGALESPRKRNWGTVAAIGVGVGVGVGVGEIVGVGVGEGPPTNVRRGEMTQPAISRNTVSADAISVASGLYRRGRYRIFQLMPCPAGLLPPRFARF
jgi:hypothetical protein